MEPHEIFFAINDNDFKKLKSLVKNGADINTRSKLLSSENNTPLIIAAFNGNIEIVKFLLENGADINAQGKKGTTALINALEYKFTDIVQLLLDKNANVFLKMEDGTTALTKAVITNQTDIIKMLIDKGADVNELRDDGWTPIFFAALSGSVEVADILIEKGANINQIENNGKTPLMTACYKGNIDLVKLLLSKGAKIDVKDIYGNTAISQASEQGYNDIVKLLTNNGANVQEIKKSNKQERIELERECYSKLSESAKNELNSIVKWLKKRAAHWAKTANSELQNKNENELDDSVENIWHWYVADQFSMLIDDIEKNIIIQLEEYAINLGARDYGNGVLIDYFHSIFYDIFFVIIDPENHHCIYE